jgi:tetratricopeptide (TPR) repeat protein
MASINRKFQQRRLEAARGYLILGMPDQALRELQAITNPERCAFDYHLLTAESRRERLEYGHAVRAFLKALDERPDNLQALLGLAWSYKRLNHLDLAIETLQLAKTAHPDEPLVIYNLSCYYTLAGNKPKAIECLGLALRMEPAFGRLISEETDFDSLREDPDFQFVAHSVVDFE